MIVRVQPAPAEISALNAVCPYFTMFPLAFPLSVLARRAPTDKLVLDPFCGRGTTNFAARLSGLRSVGLDASPVAVAIASAKVVSSTPGDVVRVVRRILERDHQPELPTGGFWRRAYRKETLRQICLLREELLRDCSSPARIALRAIVLGALHGPMAKTQHSYFSNQCPRTFAPKPRYALRYWTAHRLSAPKVDALKIITQRARRFLAAQPALPAGAIMLADSRSPESLRNHSGFDWVITSPPYYGMRTYIPDQWLRHWFVGGPSTVEYTQVEQLSHGTPEAFAAELGSVWQNAAAVARRNARLVCRFGGIRDRRADPLEIARESFRGSGWHLQTAVRAGTALDGRRQSRQFSTTQQSPRQEYDFYAVRS